MIFPQIDPIIFQLGPLAVRWYGLMYLFGFGFSYLCMLQILKWRKFDFTSDDISDMLFYAVFGVIIGGRLGYVIFYNASYYLQNPVEIPAIWQGGMSFHGGFIGVVVALILFGKRRKKSLLVIGDLVAVATPIGLFFGRIGNFINAELWGRVTDVSWGVVFPGAGILARHPSQLYEAALEGIVLFVVLLILHLRRVTRGMVMFGFISGYGLARFIVEFFREPDAHIGFLPGQVTMGQLLSLPMFIAGLIGIYLVWHYRKRDV
jgi:phosphatidylglycerol:prolipoprotein diacylglycerol transferase